MELRLGQVVAMQEDALLPFGSAGGKSISRKLKNAEPYAHVMAVSTQSPIGCPEV